MSAARRRQRAGLRRVSNVRRALRKLPVQFRTPVKEAVADSAQIMLAEAVDNAPERFGNTKNALSAKLGRDGFSAKIGILGKRAGRKAWYARFLEYGTVKMPGTHFLERAFDNNIKQANRIVEQAIKKVLLKVRYVRRL